MARVEFWFEFGSTYTYLGVARIGAAARAAGVELAWRPFLPMPLLVDQGMTRGPFLPYPRKFAYMERDLERRAHEHGLPYVRPPKYPPGEVLTSARPALLRSAEGWVAPFVETALRQHWSGGAPIGTRENVAAALERARSTPVKDALHHLADETTRRGLFGSPSLLVGDEPFWGDERLEQALAWVRRADAAGAAGRVAVAEVR